MKRAGASVRYSTGSGCSPRQDTTVYAIRPGRSFDDATAILDADYDGVVSTFLLRPAGGQLNLLGVSSGKRPHLR